MQAGPVLRGLKRPTDLKIGDSLFMDNAFSGRCEGFVTRVLWDAIPSNEDVSELPWVNAMWVYTGNGRPEPANGCCGSVIWDEEENAVALFRFAFKDGSSYAVSVDPLIEIGMVIEPIVQS
jgi:hypothetical protein